jgi:uncharacterized protein
MRSITTVLKAEEPRATVDRFVHALVEQRLDDARRLLHDELVVYEPGGLPFSGEYRGPQGFFELLGKISETLGLTLDPAIQYLLTKDTVAMRTRMKFTSRGSGRSAEVGLEEIYTVRDGLIAELDVYYKDPSAVAALIAA